MVQTFTVFADRSAAAKIRTVNFLVLVVNCWWVWSRQSASVKLRTTKFSSEGLGAIPQNFAPAKISGYMVTSSKIMVVQV